MLRSLQLIVQKQLSGRFTSVNIERKKKRANNGMNGKKTNQTKRDVEKKVGRRQVIRCSYERVENFTIEVIISERKF